EQGRAGLVLAGYPGDDAGPAGMGFVDLGLQPGLVKQAGDVFGRGTLAGARVVAPVTGIDPDQVAAQRRDLVFGGHGRRCWVLGHASIVAGPAGVWHPGGRWRCSGPDAGRGWRLAAVCEALLSSF